MNLCACDTAASKIIIIPVPLLHFGLEEHKMMPEMQRLLCTDSVVYYLTLLFFNDCALRIVGLSLNCMIKQ